MRLAIVMVTVVGCTSGTDPQLTSIEPAVATSLVETSATIHGIELAAVVHVDLDTSTSSIDRGWQIRVAGELIETTWRDRTQLDIVIPRGLTSGVHDVVARAPDGGELVLPAALTITAEPVGLRLSIEDARGGSGQPISGLRVAGDQGNAYAIVRDPAGAFVMDVAATWSTTGPFAHVAPSSDHALFEARIVGTGHLIAYHAGANLDAESGDLTTIAGATAGIAIADGPAGTGVVIGDRSGLTTDADGGLTAHAIGVDAFGNSTGDVTAMWSLVGVTASVPGAPATTALIDFATPGAGQLHATHATLGTSSTGTLSVVAGRAATIAIAPTTLATTADAAPLQLAATAVDGDGNATTNLGTLTWSVGSGPITALDPATGVLAPTRAGTGTIVVTSSLGVAAQSGTYVIAPGAPTTLTIVPPSMVVSADATPVAFSVIASDADGNLVQANAPAWSIASGPISTINPATGLFDPQTAGSGLVVATLGGTTAMALVTITPGRVAGLTIAPETVDIAQDSAAVAFTATGRDGDGNATTDLGALAWTIATGPIGTLSIAGALTPTMAGVGTVRVTSAYGPTDLSGTIRIRRGPNLDAAIAVSTLVALGGEATVTLTISNTGEGPAANVTPCALQLSTGLSLVTGPLPAQASIGPNANTMFTWTISASSIGIKQVSGCASGVDPITSSIVSSPTSDATFSVGGLGVVEIAANPFGDGTRFGFVTGYGGHVYLGPNVTGENVVRFVPGVSGSETQTFVFARDVTGSTHDNAAPTYTSIGSLGCAHDTAECGPHNEDGRGVLTSVTLGGVEWLVMQGAHDDNKPQYLYMTTDTDTVLDFRYVDLKSAMPGEAYGATAIVGLGDTLYLGMVGKASGGPALLALTATPTAPGLDTTSANLVDLDAHANPGLDNPTSSFEKIDALSAFGGLLYVANASGWVRATVANPRAYASAPGDWRTITPSSTAYTQLTSRATGLKFTDIEPADRSVPQLATFGGRLFAGRNTTVGPQLWSCQPATSGTATQCESADWTLVAGNSTGNLRLSQFDDPGLTSISMVVATSQHLYVGFDSTTGVKVFRTTSTTATARADFDPFGGAGLGNPARTHILDAKAITTGGATLVWLTIGDGTSPLSLVTLP